MKVLHLYSNHKWTGPADHALNLVTWLNERPGLDPFLACGRRPVSENQLHAKAQQRNLSTVVDFYLTKHLNWRIIPDMVRLRRQMGAGGFDLIHSHQDNDCLAAVMAGCGSRLVCSVYAGNPRELRWRQRWAISRAACVLTASGAVRDYLAGLFSDKPVSRIDVPVDLKRFAPRAKKKQLLAEFNLIPGQPVAGIVARVQRHRRFELLIQAIRNVVSEIPDFKFLIIGRGTEIDELAHQPVLDLGLQNNVVLTGYREDDFPEVLNLMDFKVFLVPGSDGACRAVREALACGKPVVATRRGILSELITDGHTGRLIDEDEHSLTQAILDLSQNRAMRQHWGRNARDYACTVLSPEKYVTAIMVCYQNAMKQLKGRG